VGQDPGQDVTAVEVVGADRRDHAVDVEAQVLVGEGGSPVLEREVDVAGRVGHLGGHVGRRGVVVAGHGHVVIHGHVHVLVVVLPGPRRGVVERRRVEPEVAAAGHVEAWQDLGRLLTAAPSTASAARGGHPGDGNDNGESSQSVDGIPHGTPFAVPPA
jgi:hypothetical protein